MKRRVTDPLESRLREDIEFIESELAKIDSPTTEYQKRLRSIYLAMLDSHREKSTVESPAGTTAGVKTAPLRR